MSESASYDPEDYGAFFGTDPSVAQDWGRELRASEKTDRQVLAEVVAGIGYAIYTHPEYRINYIQLGNIAARMLHEEAGFHRRPNC